MTKSALSKIERGANNNPTIATLDRIGRALGGKKGSLPFLLANQTQSDLRLCLKLDAIRDVVLSTTFLIVRPIYREVQLAIEDRRKFRRPRPDRQCVCLWLCLTGTQS